MTQNQLAYQANLEAERANRAREAELNRSNLEREAETKRSNLEKERQGRQQNTLRTFETSGKIVQNILNPLKWFIK